jgi:hypothetical protein
MIDIFAERWSLKKEEQRLRRTLRAVRRRNRRLDHLLEDECGGSVKIRISSFTERC